VSRRAIAVLTLLLTTSAFAGGQVTASKAALSTASPYATKAGLSVLKNGGNAIDAAVAVAFVLAVAHPQAGNLGGGGFLTYYDAPTKGVWTLDFREVAPYAATREMFAQAKGEARTGARAVAVPGTIAGLEAMHGKFGSRPWKELLAPAISLARDGIRVDAELSGDLTTAQMTRKIDPPPFFTEGKAAAAGATLAQPELALTIQRLAEAGPRDFYDGALATKLVEGLRTLGGTIGFRDLREYKPVWRAPIQLRFGNYDLYTVAPPSGGGLVMGTTLNILHGYDLAKSGFQTPKTVHLLIEAQRRAYLDRNKYLGDPVGTRIPYRELLSAERAALWRKSIDPTRATPTLVLTEPGSVVPEGEHTTHFTIVDAEGNIAAVTTSLGDDFGSGVIVPGLGFFLNGAMDDFTIAPATPTRDALLQGNTNVIEPGKRAASSMAPTIILRDGKPFLALGTKGGPSIPNTILQVFLNVAVYKKSLQEAVAAPRWHHQGLPEDAAYERTLVKPALIETLNGMGHGVAAREAIGDVHAILIDKGRITAVADPRRGGAAGGY
jgi:gamma-glutamyltranspeptidase/glutathione hydrolase